LKLLGKSRLMLVTGYYALSGAIFLLISVSSPVLWFFSGSLAVVALAASYGLHSRRGWGWLLSELSSFLGIVFWGTSLYASWQVMGNPFTENPPASADTILAIDVVLIVLVLFSVISLLHTYMNRNSFSGRR
jgi:hypothetical protein